MGTHTYAFELRDVTTYIGIESPEKRCGKTTLLAVLNKLVNRPVAAANISPSALFRVIQELAMGAAHAPIWRRMINVSVPHDLHDSTILDYGCNQGMDLATYNNFNGSVWDSDTYPRPSPDTHAYLVDRGADRAADLRQRDVHDRQVDGRHDGADADRV